MFDTFFKKGSPVFNIRTHFLFTLFLMTIIITDTSIIKLYDIVNKDIFSVESQEAIFTILVSFSIFFQVLTLRYANGEVVDRPLRQKIHFKIFNYLTKISYLLVMAFVASIISSIFFSNYYFSSTLSLVIVTNYIVASVLIGNLAILFLKWYKIRQNFLVLMYFISMSLVVFNLMTANIAVNIGISDRPEKVREYAGGTMDISGGKYATLALLFKISTMMSFVSIWFTVVIMTHSYKDRILKREFRYWIMPSLLIVYFFVSYFSQEIFSPILVPLLRNNPYLLSATLTMIFTLVKPVGGIMFGLAFWNLAKTVSYEKSLRNYLTLTGIGFLLLFSANQTSSLVLLPYPPFGTATIAILMTSAYLIMVGVYSSAVQVSSNTKLRVSIKKAARESGLLDILGSAEMQARLNQVVSSVVQKAENVERGESSVISTEIDKSELKSYMDKVVQELRKREIS